MNKVMLIGNVGKEPDVRYYEADQAVAQVSLATTEKGYTLPNGTQIPDRTEWHNLVFYRSLAKIVEKYVHKGDKLYVEGKIRYRFYDDKQGKRRFVTEIYVDNMELLTPKSASTHATDASTSTVESQTVGSQAETSSTSDNSNLPF
nr:single-stranded DNA-binding protein [Prevotella sp.]